MLIDRSHRGWALGTGAALALASAVYVFYAREWTGGPSGRTWPGMLFGVAGTLCMIFAGLLSARKKTIRARFGDLSTWLKGHIWLGLLSVPLIFFHAAFRLGGTLEVILWVLLAIVIVSGVYGIVLQNFLPRSMKAQLTREFIPDQFGETCRRLIAMADEKVVEQCTAPVVEAALVRPPDQPVAVQDDPLAWLADLHIRTVRRYLADGPTTDQLLSSGEQAGQLFDQVRATLPDTCHATVDALEQACDDRRQLAEQQRMHGLLHGWLKIHIPVSVALAVFTAVHVIMSLYY